MRNPYIVQFHDSYQSNKQMDYRTLLSQVSWPVQQQHARSSKAWQVMLMLV